MDRSQEIIRTSWIGIAANVLLAGFKAAVGILASSVAIVMDAVNNLGARHASCHCSGSQLQRITDDDWRGAHLSNPIRNSIKQYNYENNR